MTNKSYRELVTYKTFEERFSYLNLSGIVGDPTFGSSRYINQKFYTSAEWRRVRDAVVVRDGGCDLGLKDYEIYGKPYIHHINPLKLEHIESGYEAMMFGLDNLICVSHETHNAIHFGTENLRIKKYTSRTPGDTRLW